MSRKGAIIVLDHKGDQLLSSLFLVKRKDERNLPVVNLKDLNNNIPYQQSVSLSLSLSLSLSFFLEKAQCKNNNLPR